MTPYERQRANLAPEPIQYMSPGERAQMDHDWALILEWDCDECPARGGEICTNRQTGNPFGSRAPGHLSRIRKAYGTYHRRTA